MATNKIVPIYANYRDTDGSALDNGYIYIGTDGLEPIANPISIFWDSSLSISATQPVRTTGGYPINSGAVGKLYSNASYSIRVNNKKGNLVYSSLSETNT